MWDYLYKFFEYMPWYIGLVLVPAIIRMFIDTVVIKIPTSNFMLPPSEGSRLSIKYEDAFSSFVGSALYAPLFEEIVFRAAPYLFLGTAGLVVGNIVWILAHPTWQLRYVSGLPTKTKVAFTINTVFYYSCCAVFFSIPWLQGYGLLAIAYHMFHNGVITLAGIFSEIELPAPWKKEEGMFFKESRGVKKKLEEMFFKDTNPPKETIEIEDVIDVDIDNSKFFREIREKVRAVPDAKERVKAIPVKQSVKARKTEKPIQRVTAKVDKNSWSFWLN